jgi:hypothetical protein
MNNITEFEIKLKGINRESFLKIFNFAKTTYKVDNYEMDLNIIENKSKISSIRRRTFYNDKATKINKEPIIIKKNNINKKYINNVYDVDLVLSHSTEEPIEKYTFGSDFLIRLKRRLSFKLNEDYRLDLTVIKNETNITSLDVILHKFFKGFNQTNFMEHELFIDNYEIEIEFTGSRHMELRILEDELPDILNMLNIFKNPINEIYGLMTDNHKKYNIQLRDIMNSAKQLNKFTYYKYIYPANGYILLEKTDGLRVICALLDSTMYILFAQSNKNYYNKLSKTIFDKYNFIMDGEYIDGKIMIFDIMYINNKKVWKENYINRLKYFEDAKKITDSLDKKIFNIEYKKFYIINNNFKQLIETIYLEEKGQKKIDGLIIAEPDKNYFNTTNYKWKPFEHNTIDFYAKLIKNENSECIYYLYSYVTYEIFNKLKIPKTDILKVEGYPNIINILFSPSIDPKAYIFKYKDNSLNGKVIELGKNRKNLNWTFHKIREDKEFGNNFQTAEMTYYNFYSPFDIEMLYTFDEDPYFINKNEKHDNFAKVRHFNTMIKYELYKMFKDSDFVLDLAAGRGADLNKYYENNIKHVLMVEIDPTAIYTILERKYSNLKNKFQKHDKNTQIYILKEDLTTNYLDTYDKIVKLVNKKTFNHICSHFAIHYFIYTKELMLNFINFLNLSLEKNGIFICTLFDGNKVANFLQNRNNNEWKTDKYYIKLLNNKKEIELILPFSNNELYKEYIINIDEFISEMKNNNFKLIEKKNFLGYNNSEQKELDEDDKIFIDLYCALIFTKK